MTAENKALGCAQSPLIAMAEFPCGFMMIKSIALLGFYGTGKSRIGQRIAVELGIPFAALNEEMERRSGYRIKELHQKLGDVAFRQFESLTISSLAATGGVVATTGGCIVGAYNRRVLQENFLSFYLRLSFDTLYENIDSDRYPTVAGLSRMELSRLYEMQDPLYARTADHIIDAALPLETLLERILDVALAEV